MNPVPLNPNPDFGSTLVSVFDHVFDVSDPGQRPLADILNAIRDGFVAEQIAVIRAVQGDTASTHEIQAVLITQLAHV